jgi:glutamate N-acetyltransferase/amino-acid N-acetyltransferase
MRDIPTVRGFRFAGVAAQIKKNGRPDLAAIVADAPATAAALFTTNLVKAAPVLLASERIKRGRARAALVNAGCANACTGAAGLAAAKATTKLLARALGVHEREVIPASTGVIGAPLPVEKFEAAMPALVADLSYAHALHFADAICTTDRWRKVSDARARVAGAEVTALCIAKGAGMIHPNMATTLVFLLTDARVAAPVLERALRAAADSTMNAVSVDGDTSTNDMLLAMASGAAEGARSVRSAADVRALTRLFTDVLEPIAKSIAADGEGAEHLVTIEVSGAANDAAARTIARTIATSPLVKTAFFGKDPNWGRILAAAGRSGVMFDPARAAIAIDDVEIVRGGMAVGGDAEKRAHERMLRPAYAVRVSVGRGRGRARYFTCDIGHAYVDVNASYRS